MAENVTAYAPYDSEGNRVPVACPVNMLYDENGYGAADRRYLPVFYDVSDMSPIAGVTGFLARYENGLVIFQLTSTAAAGSAVKNGSVLLTNLPLELRPSSSVTFGISTCTGPSGLMRSAANMHPDGRIAETHSVNEDRISTAIYSGMIRL